MANFSYFSSIVHLKLEFLSIFSLFSSKNSLKMRFCPQFLTNFEPFSFEKCEKKNWIFHYFQDFFTKKRRFFIDFSDKNWIFSEKKIIKIQFFPIFCLKKALKTQFLTNFSIFSQKIIFHRFFQFFSLKNHWKTYNHHFIIKRNDICIQIHWRIKNIRISEWIELFEGVGSILKVHKCCFYTLKNGGF